ncbi:hypothetical protein SAMN04244574_01665 [Azotobacter beijerinckii]|uniref:Uncharacterized protein n=1 Tax=Azotobacter beijerinckii TaxID=170623 RepID=A0A1I4BVX8_9GAMM|nr:hypothetical protein SAMN04244571_02625 [Azotobacter beijerinckii]SFK72932.1 hypothetical protein SAMN04244574_01665 [Azotobacter beijerinckii]
MVDPIFNIGDLGKHCFHLHGKDAQGRMVFRKTVSSSQINVTALMTMASEKQSPLSVTASRGSG